MTDAKKDEAAGAPVEVNAIVSFFYFLFHPRWWMMNNAYTKLWDEELNQLLKTDKFTAFDGYTAKIGGKEIWVANYPHGCFNPINRHRMDIRPSRRTIRAAYEKLQHDVLRS